MTALTFHGKGGLHHKKIVGDFGEHLMMYWLSKHGYECAHIDHVGIDLIAAHPDGDGRLGISVKSRNRQDPKTANSHINIMEDLEKDLEKICSACKAFGCEPYIAVVVDKDTEGDEKKIYGFMTSVKHFLKMHRPNTKTLTWKMKDKDLESYRRDDKVRMFECDYKSGGWL